MRKQEAHTRYEKQPDLVQGLLDPAAYEDEPGPIELVETHISWIFLGESHVHKVKKPVDYGFLDFTTLERRRRACHREVELNRRLSPSVYLGVEKIKLSDGRFRIGGPGKTVDYAVVMRRLPKGRSLTALIERNEVSDRDVRRIAERIARFHQDAETGADIARVGGPATVRRNVEENFAQTRRFIGDTITRDAFDDLVAYSSAFMDANGALLARRASQGRVRDCHGDLHCAQIFLDEELSFIDTIEFNDEYRYSDVASDIAFLAMDLEFHGRPDLSAAFVDGYVRESEDLEVLKLLNFFKVYRAYVRGKVTSFRLDEPGLSGEERAALYETARRYFKLAHSYVSLTTGPTLILVAGLTGSGKTTIARELARRWDLMYVSSDVTRKALAGIAATERRFERFGEGIYAEEGTARTYEALFDAASEHLKSGTSVVVDATFRRAGDRARAEELARRHGAELWVVECTLGSEETRRRLALRARGGPNVSDGRWEIFLVQRGAWEPVTEVAHGRHVVLETGGEVPETVDRLLYGLFRNALS